MAENFVKGFQTDKGVELYDYNALGNLPTLITQEQLEAVQAAANKYTDDEIAKLDLNGAGSEENTPTPSQANPFNITSIISAGQDFSELTESGIYQIYKAAAENSQNCPTTNGGVLTVKARQNETNPILQYMIDTTGKTYTRYKTSTSWSAWKEYVITSSLSEYTKKSELETQVEQSLLEALEQIKQDGAFKGEPGDDYILTEADKNEIANIVLGQIEIPDSPGDETVDLTGYATEEWVKKQNYLTSIPSDYVTSTELTEEINSVLAQAKENGDFKGEPGDDYILTEADKQEIANMIQIPDLPDNPSSENKVLIIDATGNVIQYTPTEIVELMEQGYAIFLFDGSLYYTPQTYYANVFFVFSCCYYFNNVYNWASIFVYDDKTFTKISGTGLIVPDPTTLQQNHILKSTSKGKQWVDFTQEVIDIVTQNFTNVAEVGA